MKFLHYQVRAGAQDFVVVTMNEKTDFQFSKVSLLDEGNYYKYRMGKSSENKQQVNGAPCVLLEPPYAGTWHVIIELGHPGELRAIVEVKKKGR
jgi:hypothetical protein